MTAVWAFLCAGATLAGMSVGFVAGYRYGDRLRQARRDVIDYQGEEIEARKLADWRKDHNVVQVKSSVPSSVVPRRKGRLS